jgi:CRP/FNR family transcriptional regulator, cyclic AMP receptor protein
MTVPAAWGEVAADCARPAEYRAGDYLLREGASADTFFVIESGRVVLEASAPARPAAPFSTLGAGDVLGLSWLVPPYRWAYDARALEPVRAVALDARCVRARCEADPRVGYAVATQLLGVAVRRLHEMRLQHLDLYGAPRR